MSIDSFEQRLHEALAGTRPPGSEERELRALVALSAAVTALEVPTPGDAALERMRLRLEQLWSPAPRTPGGWLLGWIGAGPQPRPLVQRFAAGVLAVALVGTGAAGAAGVTPTELASNTGDFVGNVVRNLDPRGGSGDGAPDPSPMPNPTFSPTPSVEPTPPPETITPSPAETPSPDDDDTPEPDDDDTPDLEDDDTPEPDDDDTPELDDDGGGG